MGVPDASARAAVGQLIEKDEEAHLIVTSSEAVGMLKNLVQDAYGDAGLVWLLKQSMLVTHARIAENATSAGFAAVHRCEPGDDALVRALEYLP
jgi:uroporphyrinogen-III synthase